MRNVPLRLCIAAVLSVLFAAAVAAGEQSLVRCRLAAMPDGGLAGGYQAAPGNEGEFVLFTFDSASGTAGGLGRYNGQLAGVAAGDEEGTVLALTRDGSLGSYGGETRILALPGSHWRMLDLVRHDGDVAALHYEGDGRLLLARPGDDQNWTLDETPAAVDPNVAKAVLISTGDELHLLWIARIYDLSRGAVRHSILREGKWEEQESLATGDVRAFTAFAVDGALTLVAFVPALLADDPGHFLIMDRDHDGKWTRRDAATFRLGERLALFPDFSALNTGDGEAWLYSGRFGTYMELGGKETTLSDGVVAEAGWSGLATLGMFLAFLVLLALYCRRSRVLSRRFPGRPPDIVSRAVALAVDWIVVSVGMTAYHYATGDVNVLDRLVTIEAVNRLFWINLAAFSLYAAAMEGFYGFTVGKYLCGLRVRSVLGGRPAFLQALLRNVFRGVDMFPLPLGIPGLVGLIAVLFNRRRQRIGDMIGATVVRRHLPLEKRHFVLASASPRRSELLRALGLDILVEPADIDEDSVHADDPRDTARLLAQAKARAVAERLQEREAVIIAADTMVVLDGEVLGKPVDAADATRMLERLSGRSHTVVTGVTVWDSTTGQGLTDVEVTEVEFRNLSEREIQTYVASGDPMDKAGAYGIQSGTLVKQVRGSLSNVAGLPMEKLQGLLAMLDS